MVSTSSITMQSLGKTVQCTPAVSENMVFVTIFVLFSLSRSEAGALFIRGGHSLSNYCHGLWVDFDAVFTFFEIIALSDELDSSHFCC